MSFVKSRSLTVESSSQRHGAHDTHGSCVRLCGKCTWWAPQRENVIWASRQSGREIRGSSRVYLTRLGSVICVDEMFVEVGH